VTGASDGIGKGFAEELARAGFNIVLVSRTESKLKELASKLSADFKIETKYVAADLSGDIPTSLGKIKEVVENINNITILVNNVGVNSNVGAVQFIDMTDEEIHNQLHVNVVFTTKITKMFIPILIKNKRSAIINLSSVSATFPSAPYLTVYAASKAYISNFSVSLNYELKGKGCDVIATSPGYVVSSMSGFKRPNMFVLTPNRTARDTFSKLGTTAEVTPSWPHALERLLYSLVPPPIWAPIIASKMKTIRDRILKRKQS